MTQASRPSSAASLAAAAAAALSISFASASLYKRRKNATTSSSNSDDSILPYPPTPPSQHWLFGHALALQPDPTKPKVSHDILFESWMHKLNSKVVMFQLPVIGRFICVGDPTVARHVLMTTSFRKSPTYGGMVPLIGEKSMVATEGKEWSSQRRLYNPGFSPEFLRMVVGTIVEKCNRFIAKCDEDIESGVPTDMLARAVDLTSDVIAQVAFGEDWGSDEPTNEGIETLATIRDLTIVVGENMSNPLQRYFGLRSMWKTWRLSKALDGSMRRLVQRRLEKLASPHHNDDLNEKDILSLTLSGVMRSKKEANGPQNLSFSPDDMELMTSQLKTFFFAGHDTTATAIAWAYWLLVQHPETLSRALEEVNSCLGKYWAEEAMIGKKLCSTSYDKLQKCEYLDAVASETLRLYPPAATTRYASDSDASAGGFLLGNSIVHLNFYAMQRDEDVWENSNKFVPERFLGEEGKKMVSSFSFLPFSKGSRDCIGKYFAMLELKIALAALICRYDGSVVDQDEVYTTRLTSMPMGGCKVNLARRNV